MIDAAMVDGAALLAGMMHGLRFSGEWRARAARTCSTPARGSDQVYETADGGYVSFGPIDQKSCTEMVRIVGLADDGRGPVPDVTDRARGRR